MVLSNYSPCPSTCPPFLTTHNSAHLLAAFTDLLMICRCYFNSLNSVIILFFRSLRLRRCVVKILFFMELQWKDRMELDREIWVASQSHVQARLHGKYSRTFCVFTLPFKQMLPRLPSQNYTNNVHLDPGINDKTEVFLEDL